MLELKKHKTKKQKMVVLIIKKIYVGYWEHELGKQQKKKIFSNQVFAKTLHNKEKYCCKSDTLQMQKQC